MASRVTPCVNAGVDGGKGTPHVIEPSVGLDRLMLAVLVDGHAVERSDEGGQGRVVLRLAADVAPVRAAVLPLKSNHPEQNEIAAQLHASLAVILPHVPPPPPRALRRDGCGREQRSS